MPADTTGDGQPLARHPHQVFAVKFAQNPAGRRGEYFHGSAADPHDEPMQLDYFVWLIRTAREDVVVDTGFTAAVAAQRRREYLRRPVDGLAALGVEPGNVSRVILSHFHYDHVGDLAPFSSARFVVQDREMAFWTGRYASRTEFRRLVERHDVKELVQLNYEGRIEFVDGDREIVPGVSVHHVGGHTAGMQVVRVDTAQGHVVLAIDASHLYGNIEGDAPFGILTDLPGMYEAFDTIHRLASTPELIVPGHDPRVLERFDPVDGLAGVAARIA